MLMRILASSEVVGKRSFVFELFVMNMFVVCHSETKIDVV